ncbi:MAG: type IV-A pilus assembly ATPase PilB [Elusimicrobiota bacterium]
MVASSSLFSALEKRKLGDMLVEAGLITAEQLREALEIQTKTNGRLGQILLQMSAIDETVLIAFLGRQCGVPYISLMEYGEIDETVVKTVPESAARHQVLIPINKEDNTLTIAMANPLNVFAVDDLKLMTGCEINIVISSEQEIKDAIEKFYGPKGSIEEIIKNIEDTGGTSDLEVVQEADSGKDIISLEATGEDAPAVKFVNLLINGALKSRTSDIHIEPYEKSLRVRYRIDGVLHEQPAPPKKFQNAIISRIKIMTQLDIAEHRLPQDGRMKIKTLNREIDLRISILPTAFGEKIVMRILDSSSLCVDPTKLGFEPETLAIYQKNIELPYGIILITGPTGSGKSTTLYSTLSTLNFPDRNIVTIEDPVEYVLEGINQVSVKADIGLTFSAGLRSFLRQDPDIIMVGEIRDKETAEIAINAALTGHLVFSTLHTNDAPGSITRLNNMGVEPFLTASTITMVVAQRLMRVICKDCKESYEVPFDFMSSLGVKPEQVHGLSNVTLHRGRGCERCSGTGYRGRMGIHEVLELNEAFRSSIMERASAITLRQVARQQGMMSLRDAAMRKVLAGNTTIEEMLRVTAGDTI